MTHGIQDRITKRYGALTKSQKKAAEYILDNPEEVAFLSLKALSEKARVSDASIIRLSHALGLSGFSELQEELQTWLKGRLTPSERLRSTRVDRRKNIIYEEIFQSSVKNVLKAQEEIPVERFEEAVRGLDRADRIFVTGMRRSYSFAFHLYNNLSRILDNITFVEAVAGFAYDQIKDIAGRDVLVSISFSRYAKESVEITRFAKKKGAFVIAVTDSPVSPVGQLADVALCVDCGGPFFFGSHASTLVILDCLIGGLSLKHKKRYVDALTRLETTLKGCGVWVE
jgi:DNA-binding MurR/RpiR family transcriptional regulator